ACRASALSRPPATSQSTAPAYAFRWPRAGTRRAGPAVGGNPPADLDGCAGGRKDPARVAARRRGTGRVRGRRLAGGAGAIGRSGPRTPGGGRGARGPGAAGASAARDLGGCATPAADPAG